MAPRRAVTRLAVKDAIGLPSLVLLTSMMGFGSLARESGFSLGAALAATAGIWGLPGQLALAELYAAGGGAVAIVLAVSLANARFLPMAVAFLPVLRHRIRRPAWLFALVQLMSINTWAALLREGPALPGSERRRYFLIFSGICIGAALLGTAIGFLAAAALPRAVTFGLVFLNPIFFALLFAGMRGRTTAYALVIGAVTGPLMHLVTPEWGVLATGVLAGTAAFLLTRGGDGKEAGT